MLQSVSHLMESSSAEAVSETHAAAAAGRLARALEMMAVNIELDDDDDDDDEEDGGGGAVGGGGQVYRPQRLDLRCASCVYGRVESMVAAMWLSSVQKKRIFVCLSSLSFM